MSEAVYINDIIKQLNKNKKEVVTFRCNPKVLDGLKKIADENDISLSYLVDSIVTDWWCSL